MPTLPPMLRSRFIVPETLPPLSAGTPTEEAVLIGTNCSARRSDSQTRFGYLPAIAEIATEIGHSALRCRILQASAFI